MLGEWQQRSFFDPLVGTIFQVEAGGAAVPLLLESVTALPVPQRRNSGGAAERDTEPPIRQEPFSLIFKGPLEHLLPQQIYQMRPVDASEPLDLFIVPVGREQDGFVYQAIFN